MELMPLYVKHFLAELDSFFLKMAKCPSDSDWDQGFLARTVHSTLNNRNPLNFFPLSCPSWRLLKQIKRVSTSAKHFSDQELNQLYKGQPMPDLWALFLSS